MRFVKYWLPPLLWLGVIFLGSTDLMSAEHTSRFIVPFFALAQAGYFAGDTCVDSLHRSEVRAFGRVRCSGPAFASRRNFYDESQGVASDPLRECLARLPVCG